MLHTGPTILVLGHEKEFSWYCLVCHNWVEKVSIGKSGSETVQNTIQKPTKLVLKRDPKHQILSKKTI